MANGQPPTPPPNNPQTAALEEAVQMFGGMLQAFAPTLTPEQVRQTCIAILSTQEQLGQVINDAVDPAVVKTNPRWGFRLHNRGGHVAQKMGQVVVPKVFAECQDINEVMHFVTTLALLTSPVARALLAAHGYDIEFVQTKAKSPIQLVKN